MYDIISSYLYLMAGRISSVKLKPIVLIKRAGVGGMNTKTSAATSTDNTILIVGTKMLYQDNLVYSKLCKHFS